MTNIPLIQRNRISGSPQLRRANKTFASENATGTTSNLKRRLERRKNKERRQKYIKVTLDRRQPGRLRRKDNPPHASMALSGGRIGKHINTTA